MYSLLRIMSLFSLFNKLVATNTISTSKLEGNVDSYKQEHTVVKNGVKNTSQISLTKNSDTDDYRLSTKYTENDKTINEESRKITKEKAEEIINGEDTSVNKTCTSSNNTSTTNSDVKNTSCYTTNLTKDGNTDNYIASTKYTENGKIINEESKKITKEEAEKNMNNNLRNINHIFDNIIEYMNNCHNIFFRGFW